MMSNLVADVNDLKLCLEWGQPAFTIVDVRDRFTYNHGHITGAISIPVDDLYARATSSLHQERQICVYGETDIQATTAVKILQAAGFKNVSEIPGGLAAWKKIGGATEGV
ncbi:rhodanese-like domain-containing protein [Okeanomitos corallinicola TIOX110]|uniref:Rhodanese-like domain-containing protein n=1 Tax=Okeanomitos corallinicola TIOX110 TaxID=3133117 RepID=A0ABZ2UZ71_9CYAN